jgi:hypothetical protein
MKREIAGGSCRKFPASRAKRYGWLKMLFADYAVVSLHCLRVYLEKSHREALDLLSEMPHILGEIGLEPANLPDHSTLVKWFDKIKTALWRVLLRLSAQLHETSGHAAIGLTFFDRENSSKHYCRQTNYRVQTLEATALVDTDTQAILDVHCTTEKRHNTHTSAGNSPAETRATSPPSPLTKATIGWTYARNSAMKA